MNHLSIRVVALLIVGLLATGCTDTPDAAPVNHADTTSFLLTHSIELADQANERALASGSDASAVKAFFAKKFTYDFNYVMSGQTSVITEFYAYPVTKQDVEIVEISTSGPNAGEFLMIEKPELPLVLSAAKAPAIKMMFSPRGSGLKKATLLVVSKNQGAYRVELTGNSGNSPELALFFVQGESALPIPNGFRARILASTTPLTPGQCEPTPQMSTYQIRNPSRAPLSVTNAVLEGAHAPLFRISGQTFPLTIGPGERRPFSVDFLGGQPQGMYQAELFIESNDSNEASYRVPVTAFTHGPAPCLQAAVTAKAGETPAYKPVASKPVHAMGVMPTGSSASLTLHLKNTGFLPLHIPADKLAFALQPNPAPVAMTLSFPADGVKLEAGQAIAVPIAVTASTTRQPFSAEIRFQLPEPENAPTVLTAAIQGVVGNMPQKSQLSVSIQGNDNAPAKDADGNIIPPSAAK